MLRERQEKGEGPDVSAEREGAQEMWEGPDLSAEIECPGEVRGSGLKCGEVRESGLECPGEVRGSTLRCREEEGVESVELWPMFIRVYYV